MEFLALPIALIAILVYKYQLKKAGLGTAKGVSQRQLKELHESIEAMRQRIDDIDEHFADLTLMIDGLTKRVLPETGSSADIKTARLS